jgi:hypothetical protein
LGDFGKFWSLFTTFLVICEPAVGAEEDLDGDGDVVLPQKQKMLPEPLIAFALKKIKN